MLRMMLVGLLIPLFVGVLVAMETRTPRRDALVAVQPPAETTTDVSDSHDALAKADRLEVAVAGSEAPAQPAPSFSAGSRQCRVFGAPDAEQSPTTRPQIEEGHDRRPFQVEAKAGCRQGSYCQDSYDQDSCYQDGCHQANCHCRAAKIRQRYRDLSAKRLWRLAQSFEFSRLRNLIQRIGWRCGTPQA